MNKLTTNKYFTAVVILLLAANLATMVMFWMKRPGGPPPRQEPAEYLINELGLDAAQKDQYMQLVKEHQQQSKEMRDKIKNAKDDFFSLLHSANSIDSLKTIKANEAAHLTAELDIITFNHFQKIRAICKPDQQEKFDKVIQQMLEKMFEGHRPPPPR